MTVSVKQQQKKTLWEPSEDLHKLIAYFPLLSVNDMFADFSS